VGRAATPTVRRNQLAANLYDGTRPRWGGCEGVGMQDSGLKIQR